MLPKHKLDTLQVLLLAHASAAPHLTAAICCACKLAQPRLHVQQQLLQVLS